LIWREWLNQKYSMKLPMGLQKLSIR